MSPRTLLALCSLTLNLACIAGSQDTAETAADDSADTQLSGDTQVRFTTSMGEVVIQLNEADAPITAENFLAYVDEGFYDGDDGLGATTFHRVIPGFMAQGGGYTEAGAQKSTQDPIVLELNGLENVRGSVAMARTNVADSATTQFFINVVDNSFLNSTGEGTGYAVFGTVVSGMDAVDEMVSVSTNGSDKPDLDIVIQDAERL